jgi:hypothetical protein
MGRHESRRNPQNILVEKQSLPYGWSLNRLPDELGNIWQGEKLSQLERGKIIEKLTLLYDRQKTK